MSGEQTPGSTRNALYERAMATVNSRRYIYSDYYENGEPKYINKIGLELVRDPMLSKGLAFTQRERDMFHLRGLYPSAHFSEDQLLEFAKRRWSELKAKNASDLDLWRELQSIKHRQYHLYQKLIMSNVIEMSSIVYTPTIGDVCKNWDKLWLRANEMYFAYCDRGIINSIVYNWPTQDVELIVVTDGSRVLGLGDLGVNGAGICIGKSELYVAGGGVDPSKILPCCIDVGTNNKDLLESDTYFGMKMPRLVGDEYDNFVDEVIRALRQRYTTALIHFEDFSTNNARALLRKYSPKNFVFNDDIQGTGCVASATVIGALRCQNLPDSTIASMKFVLVGAGSSAIGIVDLIICKCMASGLTYDEAKRNLYVLDSKGLIAGTTPYNDKVKEEFRRSELDQGMSLLDVIKIAKPHCIIGASGTPKVFSEQILKELVAHQSRPIVLALSNPTSLAECTAEDCYKYTRGRAFFASGSPFGKVTLNRSEVDVEVLNTHLTINEDGTEKSEITFHPTQCNNVYIFPGLGMGSILTGAWRVTNEMLTTATSTLSAHLTQSDFRKEHLLPEVSELRDISAEIAAAVGLKAISQGVADGGVRAIPWSASMDEIITRVKDHMWLPNYTSYIN